LLGAHQIEAARSDNHLTLNPQSTTHSRQQSLTQHNILADYFNSAPEKMEQMMQFLGTMREEQKSGFNNMESSHNKQMNAMHTHLEDGLTMCRNEYREHARHASDRCTELETEFKKLQTLVAAAHTEIKKQAAAVVAAPAPSAFGYQAQTATASSKFVARKIFARGWCTFGCEATEGMKTADLVAAGTSLMSILSSEMQSWVMDVDNRFHAPHFRNRQLQINLNEAGPEDAGWQICRVMNDHLRNEGTTINNKTFYLTPDMELWKRQRNGCLNRASEVILRDLPPLDNSELIKDWAGGKLYFSRGGNDCLLGSWNQKTGWLWTTDTIHHLWPQANQQDLATAMEWNR
jgi:hypothetical protein